MKKKLLCCFTLLSMVAGQAMSQSQLCRPELTWGAYACISKVEINGMVSESSTTPEGWDGKIGSNTYDENVLLLITQWTESVLLRWRQVKSMN